MLHIVGEMEQSGKNVKKGRRKTFKWHKEENKKLKTEEEIINNLKKSYEEIDTSKLSLFKDLPLSPKTLKGLKECGYIKMTEIQRESIGLSLRGLDILGAAKTGSGKTLAFLIPVLEVLYCKQWTRLDGVGALIITPTRELAYQIFETLRKVGAHHDVSGGLIIGGKDLHFEKKRMNQCNIMICTPGRLLQHMDENPLFDCSNLQILVLDEADRCLDLGFEATMNSIIENLPPKRQTLLFSATQTKSVRDLARLSLKDPMYVSVHEHAKHSTPESLQQSYVVCELHDKLNMLWSFIKNHLKQKVLVFMSSCKQVKYFYEIFCRLRPGTTLLALYGTLHQMRRMAIYESFCRKSNAVLLATDIAARGLDFPEVNWVVQLDCPEDANTYIHRAGRTARYHKGGESLLVLLPSEEEGMVEQLNAAKIPIKKIRINPNKLQNPRVKIEAFLAKDVSLKESAQRAFVSYVKSVFLMKNKKVFNVNALDCASFSRSLGLAVPPRIRFLQRIQKNQNKEKNVEDDMIKSEKLDMPEDSTDSESNEDINRDEGFICHNDSDSDEDILTVKRKDHDLAAEELSSEDVPHNTDTKKKPITKVAVAKKILKKKIVANKKILFNEDGEAVLNVTREKASQQARDYDTEDVGGIDIEKAKQILREEDKYDRQHFREKVKAEHRKKKLKLKKEKEKMDLFYDEFADESEDEPSGMDLSWLPDPDEVYPSADREQMSEDEDKSNSETEVPPSDRSGKRKAMQTSSKKRKKRKHVDLPDTGLSLEEDEELALHILKQIK